MYTFKQYIEEKFVNLLSVKPEHSELRDKHSQDVFNMVKKAYEPIGGIHGSGFNSHEDMKNKIPMWKIARSEGKIRAVSLYKDTGGRKRVAVASDGTPEGKKHLARMMVDDLKQNRSYGEISGPSLSFLKKHYPDMHKHVHTFEHAKKIHAAKGDEIHPVDDNDPEVQKHPELKNAFYRRKIGGEMHTKIMLGTPDKKID
jgi:hypothetical protein